MTTYLVQNIETFETVTTFNSESAFDTWMSESTVYGIVSLDADADGDTRGHRDARAEAQGAPDGDAPRPALRRAHATEPPPCPGARSGAARRARREPDVGRSKCVRGYLPPFPHKRASE